MYIIYKNTKIYYETYGDYGQELVFLHGWGGSSLSFSFIKNYIECPTKMIFIDFPPFSKSEEPSVVFTMEDYVNIVLKIMSNQNFKQPTFIGHSFGGRVAIMLAGKGFAKNIVLINSAGLKPKTSLKKIILKVNYKLLKKFGYKKALGSKDYKNLSPVMKKTFSNIVTTYLEEYCKNINIDCLIIWGKKDKETPLYMAKKLNRLIKNSELIVYKNAGHFSYIDNFSIFIKDLNNFIFK